MQWPRVGGLGAVLYHRHTPLTSEAKRIEDRVRAVMLRADRTIAAGDTMYTGNEEHYFSVGASALRWLLVALEAVGVEAPGRILDFGCGYGRVMRTLRAAFPDAELLASDVDSRGVSHCAKAFGARVIAGAAGPAPAKQAQDIDLIWCGSVLTHLAAVQWEHLLRYFANALAPGGVAVMTTHGRRAAWRLERVTDYGLEPPARAAALASYRSTGFGYHDYPGQRGYGLSLSTPAWAIGQALDIPGLRLIGYVEAGWDWHQDVLSVAKDADRLLERV